MVAAVTTTAGGLMLAGELTWRLSWPSTRTPGRCDTGSTPAARLAADIVTYEVGDRQYIAVASGRPSRFWIQENSGNPLVMVFALDAASTR